METREESSPRSKKPNRLFSEMRKCSVAPKDRFHEHTIWKLRVLGYLHDKKKKKKVNFSVKSSQKTLYHSGGYTPSLDFIIYHYVLKAMASHSSTLAWKIPWMEEPGGLLSMGSHRVGHDWSDLAAAAAAFFYNSLTLYWDYLFTCSFPHQTESRESQGQIFLPPIICIKT